MVLSMTRSKFAEGEYALAEMTDEERGGLGRIAPVGTIEALLECRLASDPDSEEELVVYDSRDRTPITTTSNLLNQFVALENADSMGVLAFAKRWGALELCREGLPALHPRTGSCSGVECLWRRYPSGSKSFNYGCVGVDQWRRWAGHFRLLLEVALDLANDRRPSDSNLDRLLSSVHPHRVDWHDGRFYSVMLPSTPDGMAIGRPLWFEVSSGVNNLLYLAGARPQMECDFRGKRGISLGGHGNLFGVLAIKLLMAVTRGRGFEFCTHCGGLYELKDRIVKGRTVKGRKPRAGEGHYCTPCLVRGVEKTRATNRYRAKQRAAREVEVAGTGEGSSSEIIKQSASLPPRRESDGHRTKPRGRNRPVSGPSVVESTQLPTPRRGPSRAPRQPALKRGRSPVR